MAVFDRTYQPWEGTRTGVADRLLVIPRYAYRGIFSSKLFNAFFGLSFIPPLIAGGYIWVVNNVSLLQKVGATADQMPPVDAKMFLLVLYFQLFFAAAITVLQGPALVSPDLVNGALPLYLSRPVSRTQYVLGKFLVLGLLLSAITWAPLAILFFLQGSLSEQPWLVSHLRILFGVIATSLIAITVFSLFGLALSAWVRNKAIARAIVPGLLIIPGIVGAVINGSLQTKIGDGLNIIVVLERIGVSLLDVRSGGSSLPLWAALTSATTFALFSLFLLNRRLRAFEVVR